MIDWKELIGILATIFVFIGFTQKGTIRIRILNSVGSILFVVYGLLIGALSVWILNGACLILNIYKVIKEKQEKSSGVRKVVSRGDNTADISEVHFR